MRQPLNDILKEYRSLELAKVIDFNKFNEYAIVHHSSAIEGSTLTENETRLLLEEDVTPKGKPLLHSLMVKDHYQALQFILKSAEKQIAITAEFIQAINAKVMKSTGAVYNTVFGEIDATKGEFRKGNVSAGSTYFVNYDKVISYTTALATSLNTKIKSVNSDEEKLELSFAAHFDLVSIHPFYDVNGRTSRLLMNYLQSLYHLPLSIVYKEDKADYFTALQTSRKEQSLDAFFEFMYNQYQKQLKSEIDSFNASMQQEIKQNKGKGFSMFF
jgi:Fic family protein